MCLLPPKQLKHLGGVKTRLCRQVGRQPLDRHRQLHVVQRKKLLDQLFEHRLGNAAGAGGLGGQRDGGGPDVETSDHLHDCGDVLLGHGFQHDAEEGFPCR